MASKNNGSSSKHFIPKDILNDLCTRFIINLPAEDRGNLVRICFQIEVAHWFYLDYYCTNDAYKVENCSLRQFAAHVFQHVPELREHTEGLDAVLDNWRQYKLSVPTYGAILLDTDLTHVLLVQSYWTKASWGFPKGKVNESEHPSLCAAREVLEETGFDISNMVNRNEFIQLMIHDQPIRLYIVHNIPRDTQFNPRTRNEIKACEWFPIADLPSSKKDMTPKIKMGVSPNSFFMVMPFVKKIRRWIAEKNPKVFVNSARRVRHKSLSDIESPKIKNKVSQGSEKQISQSNPKQKCNTVKSTPVNKKEKKHSKRQLFTPQNLSSKSLHTELQPLDQDYDDEYLNLINYISPCWENFKFDRAAILASFD